MERQKPGIIWFRQDLRVSDNPALVEAAQRGGPLVPVFIFDELSPEVRPYGAAQKWWLHKSLNSLAQSLSRLGSPLILRRGAAEDVLADLIAETDADALFWNRRYGPGEQSVDAAIKSRFQDAGLAVRSFAGLLLHEPTKVRTGSDKPYRVYTPFWKNLSANMNVRAPLPAPENLPGFNSALETDSLSDWKLLPEQPNWAGGIDETWTPGEKAAHEDLEKFLAENLRDYHSARDLPGPDQTSRMSPRLRFGELSPHQLWHAAQDGRRVADDKARETWLKELVWREFSYHLLQHNPRLQEQNIQEKFNAFEWRDAPDDLKAWQKGMTGYPIIDAGMRQLWQTGWMHNRVRMIVGSFLIKHLLIDWREGERWFWDCLVDGDPAANPAQWQWVAGSGADAAPFFRVFNPILQAGKFDGAGTYIRRYVPELAKLPDANLAAPWEASADVLAQAGVELGTTYPHPIVDHKEGRERALERLARLSTDGADA